MSTDVDKGVIGRSGRRRSTSEETRARVLHAARLAFSRTGFEHVGVRDIAARSGTDAAIVIRLFGSKEALFREVAQDAFILVPGFRVPRDEVGRAVADFLLGPGETAAEQEEFDAFRFLLHSAASPIAAPIVSARLHTCFVEPLAAHLGVQEAQSRAALIAACVIGLTTMRFALLSPALQPDDLQRLRAPFAAAIQACVDT